MTRIKLQELTTQELVDRFALIAIQQDDALLNNETARFNKLYTEMDNVERELRSRAGDQRKMLLQLYDHPNAQVRLKAATRTLAVAPQAARLLLEVIAASRKYPQAGDAGMTLIGLNDGTFQPS